jgi:hypothetical protein
MLERAFDSMPEQKAAMTSSPIGELDVFVTGTNAYGQLFTTFDDAGHLLDIKDHRQVFRLSYRGARKNDFAPENLRALEKLSRITSCFPVAFEPVRVTCSGQAGDAEDAAIERWGKLEKESYFLDGGVLDNKPFSYAIDAIFRRTADRDVTRMLLYVEPDPERFTSVAEVPMPGRGAGRVQSTGRHSSLRKYLR